MSAKPTRSNGDLLLVVGNKNYSSWSMRAGIAMARTGAAFEEVVIPLDQPESAPLKAKYSPSGRVPSLRHGSLVVWESLAICEYLSELFPKARLWPEDPATRAIARAVSNEMHAGFAALRAQLPMNIKASLRRQPDSDVRADLDRIERLWATCRTEHGRGGSFLFGAFTIADAMFAPVVTRLRTYGVRVSAESNAYCEAVLAAPEVARWCEAARAETWSIPRYDT